MKKCNRLFATLMALTMVFAYMPAMVFADDGTFSVGNKGLIVEELAEAGSETLSTEAMNSKEGSTDVGLMVIINDNGTVEVTGYTEDILNKTTITIPDIITDSGNSYPVTSIRAGALKGLNNLLSVKVPASVTQIGSAALGYTNANTKVPGFTIIGTTGTYAQTYANTNGFAFSDPVAEAIAAAEAARQGVPDGSIPKVKTSKPTAGKKFIIIKWKKLSKKQLKKSKAASYEIWVSASAGFPQEQTSEHIIKKSKSALKITRVPKGTYYVKVRAIKYVGSVKKVGPWSKAKKVKVKK